GGSAWPRSRGSGRWGSIITAAQHPGQAQQTHRRPEIESSFQRRSLLCRRDESGRKGAVRRLMIGDDPGSGQATARLKAASVKYDRNRAASGGVVIRDSGPIPSIVRSQCERSETAAGSASKFLPFRAERHEGSAAQAIEKLATDGRDL